MTQRELDTLQCRWMELLKDYDVSIPYHLGKANVVANPLSRKVVSMGSLACILISQRPVARDIQSLANLMVCLQLNGSP